MTEENKNKLKSYKHNVGSDNIQYKEIIQKKLISNEDIIHFLNNPNLNEDEPDLYYGENILPYYLLVNAQTDNKNYICFETSFDEVPRYNEVMKLGQIIFYIICDNQDVLNNG